MNIVADESVDRAIVERLRSDGHDVQYIAELHPGIADNFVLDQAKHEPQPGNGLYTSGAYRNHSPTRPCVGARP